jgi:ribosome biogenesis GTPase / thiamine phosphate phosphatase
VSPDTSELEAVGYSAHWRALFRPHGAAGLTAARVVRSDRGGSLICAASGITRAKPAARLLKASAGSLDLPAVGDWVAALIRDDLDVPLIEAVLPRTSAITRGDPGRSSDVQVLAANVDIVFVVHPIAESPNLRRIERELTLAWESGAVPVVVLTKADLSPDVAAARAAAESVALGVDIVVTNALAAADLEPLLARVSPGRTAVLIGPSGAGKSTIINGLVGEQRQATCEVRVRDGRGRHTTVARELIRMPGGGVLIDTPGLRALGLTGSEQGIASAFPDVEDLGRGCRFGDCWHGDEPGCAVRSAVESGALPAERLASYHKLMRESRFAAAKGDARLRAAEERRWKVLSKAAKAYFKLTGRG